MSKIIEAVIEAKKMMGVPLLEFEYVYSIFNNNIIIIKENIDIISDDKKRKVIDKINLISDNTINSDLDEKTHLIKEFNLWVYKNLVEIDEFQLINREDSLSEFL